MRILRQAIVQPIKCRTALGADVNLRNQPAWIIKRPRQNGDMAKLVGFPEQGRAASAAKAAFCKSRGGIPAQILLPADLNRSLFSGGRGIVKPGLLAALAAMAINHLSHRPLNHKANSAAQTSAQVLLHLILPIDWQNHSAAALAHPAKSDDP